MPSDIADVRERKLTIALGLNVVIVVVQVVIGVVAASLGLLADAAHNLTDVAAIVVSLIAVRLARRAANASRSFGYHRGTILAAQTNAASILIVCVLVGFEAVRRFLDPQPVRGGLVLVVALVAAAVNFAAAAALGGAAHAHGDHDDHDQDGQLVDEGGDTHDLNMRSALLHMISDGAVSVGVALAGLVILLTGGWYWLDPAASLVISVVIGVQGVQLLRSTADVLLESTPAGLDVQALNAAMAAVEGVESVHDLHVWTLSSDVRALSAHLVLAGHPTLEEAQVVSTRVKAQIGGRFRISHATLEMECEACGAADMFCPIDSPREHG
ncbi:MAG: cation diffusion facilitator family transporter [Actinomycetota bacterium]|nr:cation diffusion facilitator family transporter [Actinomycetota bacterium]